MSAERSPGLAEAGRLGVIGGVSETNRSGIEEEDEATIERFERLMDAYLETERIP